MDFVTVHTTFSAAEAQLIRSRLEVADFHPNVANEASVAFAGFSKCTLIHVQVPAAEAADAREFLAATETSAE